MEQIISYLGLVLTTSVAAVIIFFSAVIAPVVFTSLDINQAGKLIRRVFPWYYAVLIIVSSLAALSLINRDLVAVLIMGAIAATTVISRQILMPKINAYRDQELAGDASAKQPFERLHRLSVWINGGQLIAVIFVLVWLAP